MEQRKQPDKVLPYNAREFAEDTVAIPVNGGYYVLLPKSDFEHFVKTKDSITTTVGELIADDNVMVRRHVPPTEPQKDVKDAKLHVSFFRSVVLPTNILEKLPPEQVKIIVDWYSDFVPLNEVRNGTRLSAKKSILDGKAKKVIPQLERLLSRT